ncbi:hypothetical protein WJT74_06875 [Sphingomicrobium sp. XHP0239]|uniref:hypothetical protein n=1 Tax=Sphingomicrobium maritimum TaxID=3133972 RepID=UPI0031CCB2EB
MTHLLTTAAAMALLAQPAIAQDRDGFEGSGPSMSRDNPDGATQRSAAAYIKIGDIKGESTDRRTGGNGGGLMAQDDWVEATRLAWGDAGSMMEGQDLRLVPAADIRVNRWETAARASDDAGTGLATGKRQHRAVTAGGIDEDCNDSCEAPRPGVRVRPLDKASPYIMHRDIDKSTPLLMTALRSSECPAGVQMASMDVREGDQTIRLSDVTVEGCQASSGPQQPGQPIYDAIVFSYGERQAGDDLTLRKRPGRR